MTGPTILPITIDGFVIDASISETHTLDAELTEFPVEQGADVSDNVRRKPVELELEGMVSDSPLPPIASQRDPNATPTQDALAKLQAVFDAGQPVTVSTALRRYSNMVMVSLEIPIDKETGRALKFTAHFKQVIIVSLQRTFVRTAKPGGQGQRDLGGRPTKVVTDPATALGATYVFTVTRSTWRNAYSSHKPIKIDTVGDPRAFTNTTYADLNTLYRVPVYDGSLPSDGYVDKKGVYHPINAVYSPQHGYWTTQDGRQVTQQTTPTPAQVYTNYFQDVFGDAPLSNL